GPALDLTGEQDRLTGLCDRARDSLADLLAIQLRHIGEAARAAYRKLAVGVCEHDRNTVGAEHVSKLRGGSLEQLIGIAFLPDDGLQVARRPECRLGVLLLPLRAPERVRFGELETDELRDPTEAGHVFRREHATHEHRREAADELILPDHRRDRERVREPSISE